MRLRQIFGELAVFVFAAVSVAGVALICGLILSGCAPRPRQPVMSVPLASSPEASPVVPSPAAPQVMAVSPQPEIAWVAAEPIKQESPPPSRKRTPWMARGGKVIFYEPGKKYSVSCPEFGAVSVVLPEGERVQAINSGNSGEWMVQQTTTGLEEPFPVIAIRRAPWAPSAELQVITDAAIYQFLLHPQQRSVSKEQISLIVVVNPETEARRAERAAARAREQERRRREQTERMPQEEFSLLGRQQ